MSLLKQQVYFFIWAIIGGVILAITYDILRIRRRIIKTKDVFVILEDIFFIVFSSCFIFLIAYYKNNSEMRFFEFLGIFVGYISFKLIFKDYFLRVTVSIANFITTAFRNFFKFVFSPFVKIFGVIKKSSSKEINKLKKLLKTINSKLDIKKKIALNYFKCKLKGK